MSVTLPYTEKRWWRDTTLPQYLEDSNLRSKYYLEHEDDPNTYEYIKEYIDPLLSEKAYDELVEGSSSISTDVWVTGQDTGLDNNIQKSRDSVEFLTQVENVPITEIVQTEIEDREFNRQFNETVLNTTPSMFRSPGRRRAANGLNGTVNDSRTSDNRLRSPRRAANGTVNGRVLSPRTGRRAANGTVNGSRISPRTGRISPRTGRISPRSNGTVRGEVSDTTNGTSLRKLRRPVSNRTGRVTPGSPRDRSTDTIERPIDYEELVTNIELIGIPPVNMIGRDVGPRRSTWIVHEGPDYGSTLYSYGSGVNLTANLGNGQPEYTKPSSSTKYIITDRSTATGEEDMDSIIRLIDDMSSRMTGKPVEYSTVTSSAEKIKDSTLVVNEGDGTIDIIYDKVVSTDLLDE